MRFLLVDETDRQESINGPFFCLCSISIDEQFLIPSSQALEKINRKYNFSNLKQLRKSGIDEDNRLRVTREIYECLKKYDVVVRAVVIGEYSLSRKLPKDTIYMGALSFLLERFALSLHEEKGSGMVIFDSMDRNIENGIRGQFYKHVLEDSIEFASKHVADFRDLIYPCILFSDDNHNTLIQAVDLIATSLNNSIFNSYKKNSFITISDLPQYNKFLEIYWPLFMTSPGGKVNGWGVKLWN